MKGLYIIQHGKGGLLVIVELPYRHFFNLTRLRNSSTGVKTRTNLLRMLQNITVRDEVGREQSLNPYTVNLTKTRTLQNPNLSDEM